MTQGNFNWFLHTMLFYHTQHVTEKQMRKASGAISGNDSDSNSDNEDDM